MSKGRFVCDADKASAIPDVEALEIEHNADGEPFNSRYRVTTEDGDVFHISAKRLRYIPIPIPTPGSKPAFVYENISEFVVEETGKMGMGIDEHMVVSSE